MYPVCTDCCSGRQLKRLYFAANTVRRAVFRRVRKGFRQFGFRGWKTSVSQNLYRFGTQLLLRWSVSEHVLLLRLGVTMKPPWLVSCLSLIWKRLKSAQS